MGEVVGAMDWEKEERLERNALTRERERTNEKEGERRERRVGILLSSLK